MKISIVKTALISLLLISNLAFSQDNNKPFKNINNAYAGIEIGPKQIRTTILEVMNSNKGHFNTINTWTDNVNTIAGINENGMIAEKDFELLIKIVQKNFSRLLKEYKINPKNIYIVIANNVSKAKNVDDLSNIINTTTQTRPKYLNLESDSKNLIKGTIPFEDFVDAFVFDISGDNSKGGIVVKLTETDNFYFRPLSTDYGTVTLSRKIQKKFKINASITDYLSVLETESDSVGIDIKEAFKSEELFQTKKNIYISGGAIWAFIVLNKEKYKDRFVEFTLQDVRNYQLDLYTNFSKFEKLAKFNSDIENVLKSHTQLHLISSNIILLNFIENINNLENKKIFYVKQGGSNWLKSAVLESLNDRLKF